MDGKLLHRWGNLNICEPGQFAAPHCICVDSEVHLCERWSDRVGQQGDWPLRIATFQKFVEYRLIERGRCSRWPRYFSQRLLGSNLIQQRPSCPV